MRGAVRTYVPSVRLRGVRRLFGALGDFSKSRSSSQPKRRTDGALQVSANPGDVCEIAVSNRMSRRFAAKKVAVRSVPVQRELDNRRFF